MRNFAQNSRNNDGGRWKVSYLLSVHLTPTVWTRQVYRLPGRSPHVYTDWLAVLAQPTLAVLTKQTLPFYVVANRTDWNVRHLASQSMNTGLNEARLLTTAVQVTGLILNIM